MTKLQAYWGWWYFRRSYIFDEKAWYEIIFRFIKKRFNRLLTISFGGLLTYDSIKFTSLNNRL